MWLITALVAVAFVVENERMTAAFSVPTVTLRRKCHFKTSFLQMETPVLNDKLSITIDTEDETSNPILKPAEQRRVLGSQENLMFPRQYAPNANVTFPQMNHVCCTVLSATPSENVLKEAIDEAIQSHPLLAAHVEGDGEPDKRVDFFKMVRVGDPDPCTFVTHKGRITSEHVLQVVEVEGKKRSDLYKSWQHAFNRDMDDGSWCDPSTGPLWKIELHKLKAINGETTPCALLFAFNHAISDQSTVNLLADQIIANIAAIEESGTIPKKAVAHDMPMSLEESVLGLDQRFSDIGFAGMTKGTMAYLGHMALDGFKPTPTILPDSKADTCAGGLVGDLNIIANLIKGHHENGIEKRSSTLQFRTLSKDTTSALLGKCREKGVSVTNALVAAVTITVSDFIDEGVEKRRKRHYKILQALDMRRFGEQLDKCDTVACMAGSMDLSFGPLRDRTGESLRSNPTADKLEQFWSLAKEGKRQTEDFVASDGPRHAVRVFDAGMELSDINNLVYAAEESKGLGRVFSAGLSNVGVYDRQRAVRREGHDERELIKIKHGQYEIEDIFFACSHARSGCLYQVSGMTVGGEMKCTFHPPFPLVSEETNKNFADAFMELLEIVAGTKEVPVSSPTESQHALQVGSQQIPFSTNSFELGVALFFLALLGMLLPMSGVASRSLLM